MTDFHFHSANELKTNKNYTQTDSSTPKGQIEYREHWWMCVQNTMEKQAGKDWKNIERTQK